MACVSCGAVLAGSDRFCYVCGGPVDAGSAGKPAAGAQACAAPPDVSVSRDAPPVDDGEASGPGALGQAAAADVAEAHVATATPVRASSDQSDPERTSLAALEVELRWGREERNIVVELPGCSIGSGPDADITVPAGFLEVCHARIVARGERWILETAASAARILRRGVPVDRAELYRGAVLRLADVAGNFVTVRVVGGASTAAEGNALRCQLPANGQTVVIGSGGTAGLRLEHPLVRPQHARLRRDRAGVVWLEDRSTVAGTYVNGSRLRDRHRLEQGDTVQVGPFSARVSHDALEALEQVDGVAVTVDRAAVTVPTHAGRTTTLLRDVDLDLPPGSLTAIAGPSGAGKSTLMRLLSGHVTAASGVVRYDGIDLVACRQAYAGIMGFVPQDDVVHADLTVIEALDYQARLRLGRDATSADRRRAIDRVLGFVDLSPQAGQLVRTLSGGQRKRVSIATELLGDPKILFLDEPTSGLDPGLDKRMMLLLRLLADEGRTVILTTHALSHVDVCDTLIVVGPGGRVVYADRPAAATDWFGVPSLGDAFTLVETPEASEAAAHRLRSAQTALGVSEARSALRADSPMTSATAPAASPANAAAAAQLDQLPAAFARPPFGSPAWRELIFYQGAIFASRHVRILARDRTALALSLSQGAAVAVLTALVSPHPMIWSLDGSPPGFVFACAAVWFGMINAVRELVKERTIWRREQLAGASPHAYLASKVAVLTALAAVQVLTTLVVLDLAFGLPTDSPGGTPLISIGITLGLATLAGTAIGLFISAIAPSMDRAMSLVPYLLVVQLILSGVLFHLGALRFLSWLVPARWAVSAFGTISGISATALRQTPGLYPHSVAALALDWIMLVAMTSAGITITARFLDRQAENWSVG